MLVVKCFESIRSYWDDLKVIALINESWECGNVHHFFAIQVNYFISISLEEESLSVKNVMIPRWWETGRTTERVPLETCNYDVCNFIGSHLGNPRI